jgi:hypothetical protein
MKRRDFQSNNGTTPREIHPPGAAELLSGSVSCFAKWLICLTLLLAICSGCSRKKEETPAPPLQTGALLPPQPNLPREELMKWVVQRYNVLLSEGYRTLNMNPMQEVATNDQAEKLYIHMAAIGEGKVRMVSQLKKIDFVQILFPREDRASVRTHEIWDFSYNDIRTGKRNEEVTDFPYDVTYSLEKMDGRWLIADVVAISEQDERENMKHLPHAGRGGHP